MFTNEDRLQAARAQGDLGAVYRELTILGWHQLKGSLTIDGHTYHVGDPTEKRDIIHDAAAALVMQLQLNPSKRIDYWHVNLRYCLKDVLRAKKKQSQRSLSLEELYETGGIAL